MTKTPRCVTFLSLLLILLAGLRAESAPAQTAQGPGRLFVTSFMTMHDPFFVALEHFRVR